MRVWLCETSIQYSIPVCIRVNLCSYLRSPDLGVHVILHWEEIRWTFKSNVGMLILALSSLADGFHGGGFTSGGQESGSVFSAAVCKIQASKHYVESSPLVLKDKRSCFSQGERFTVQLPLVSLDCGTFCPEVGRLIGIWKPSIMLPSPQSPANSRFDHDCVEALYRLLVLYYYTNCNCTSYHPLGLYWCV